MWNGADVLVFIRDETITSVKTAHEEGVDQNKHIKNTILGLLFMHLMGNLFIFRILKLFV